jgi:hypothetical protein
MARILLCVTFGLQFGHQVIAHHHQEETEIDAGHHDHDHDDNDDHDSGSFPAHYISHSFSAQTSVADLLKFVFGNVDCSNHDIVISPAETGACKVIRRRYLPPPLPHYYRYFSLRAPPAC